MRNDPDPIVRRYAAFGMAFIDSEDVESVIEAALALETDGRGPGRPPQRSSTFWGSSNGCREVLAFLESDDSGMYGPVLQGIARDTRAEDVPAALQAVRAALTAGPDAEKAARLRRAEEELMIAGDNAAKAR